jgi:lipopolysaccharide transport system ATP-binding protein
MSRTVIKFENLSKLYRLGEVGTGTISHDLNRWWKMNIQGQPDPYTKIGHTNDRTTKAEKGEVVWALKDIDFEVKEGEVLGIIGRNGAGKSTLLKILSKVTSPTTGCIKIKGRIASLLEVGTGFNPEMTGRENIYMNGTIMGMRKWEIDKKLDEIVDFAGVAKYLDTPVKRYSSGMTVRLGFAVAAHLEPEILVVDEVLAVGDIEFQEKCIGKMKDVSKNEGRTVIFVSHNMAAVSEICHSGIILEKGKINEIGEAQNIVRKYMQLNRKYSSTKYIANSEKDIFIEQIELKDQKGEEKGTFSFSDEIAITIKVKDNIKNKTFKAGVAILDENSMKIFTTHSNQRFTGENFYKIKVIIPSKTLLAGHYSLDAAIFIPMGEVFDYINSKCEFRVVDTESDFAIFNDANQGKVNIPCKWEIK